MNICWQASACLTVQPRSDASGPNLLLMDPPALKRAMSTPLKLHMQYTFQQSG